MLASLPSFSLLQRTIRTPNGRVARLAAGASERSLLLATDAAEGTGAGAGLSVLTLEPNCDGGGCICANGIGSGAATAVGAAAARTASRHCTRAVADVSLDGRRIALPLEASAGVPSALAADVVGGWVFAATWGRGAEPAAVLSLEPRSMRRVGAPLMLRAGFGPVLASESAVRSLHVVPQSRLLLAVCAGAANTVVSTGTIIQMRIGDDGTLHRLASLGNPQVSDRISVAVLDIATRPTGATMYALLASLPPALLAVDALEMKVVHRWELAYAARHVACGLALPNGDLIFASLGGGAVLRRHSRSSSSCAHARSQSLLRAKNSSMRQRARYASTARNISPSVPTGSVVTSVHSTGVTSTGASISQTRIRFTSSDDGTSFR
jgi:hypothetical protein